MENLCKNCKYWIDPGDGDYISHPVDQDSFEEMKMPFEVRECKHPKLLKFERTPEIDGFCITDASDYRASLYTGPLFGCNKYVSN